MGTGIDMAKQIDPEFAQALENMRDQLLIVFVNRMGGEVRVPVSEVDGTGGWIMKFGIDAQKGEFIFKTEKKQ